MLLKKHPFAAASLSPFKHLEERGGNGSENCYHVEGGGVCKN